jgi:hypothetical protein
MPSGRALRLFVPCAQLRARPQAARWAYEQVCAQQASRQNGAPAEQQAAGEPRRRLAATAACQAKSQRARASRHTRSAHAVAQLSSPGAREQRREGSCVCRSALLVASLPFASSAPMHAATPMHADAMLQRDAGPTTACD